MPENIDFELPLLPWSLEDARHPEAFPDTKGKGFISRFGPEKAEELYCLLATRLGYFNPKNEPTNYRPSLDPTPYLDQIKAQHGGGSAKKADKGGNS